MRHHFKCTATGLLAVAAGLSLCLAPLGWAAVDIGGRSSQVPPPVVDPATGKKTIVVSPDWKLLYPFSERFAEAATKAAGGHAMDLAAAWFATDALVRRGADGKRQFLDPNLGSFPPELIRAPFQDSDWDYFIVQAANPAGQTRLRSVLKTNNIPILGYLPDLAYLVRASQAQARLFRQKDEIFWAGLFHPAYRIAPKLDYIIESDPGFELTLTVHFDRLIYQDFTELFDLMRSAGLEIVDFADTGDYWLLRVEGLALDARRLAAEPGCLWVERWVEPVLHNNVARTSANTTTGRGATAGPIMDVEDVWARGIRGEGQIASAADTGLSTGSLATLHRDFGQQGSATNPMRVIAGYALGRATWDDNQTTGGGHGTHTSGSIVGNGFRSGSTPNTNTFPSSCYAGIAPKAQFVFQSVMDSGGNLGGLPADLNSLFQQTYDAGARIHSNSWGAAAAGAYDVDSQNVDEFCWAHKDMVITFSAGNEGEDGTYWNGIRCANTGEPIDGVIDTNSIGSPGTAKNCITIGASENYRPNFVYQTSAGGTCSPAGTFNQRAWGWGWCYTVAPIYADYISNHANGLAAFSSRGPAADLRFKPDLVAPGAVIASTRTDLNQAYEDWGECEIPAGYQTYYLNMGGTSMSNPLTAGCATLVRQYFADGWHANHSGITNGSAVPANGFNPSAALVKATLINGAWDMTPGQYGTGATQEIPPSWDTGHDLPNNAEGFGRVDLEHSLFPGSGWGDNTNRAMEIHDVTPGLTTGNSNIYTFYVSSNANPFIVTLVWTDPYGATSAATELVNDLDLRVTAPNGTTVYYPNKLNNTGGSVDRKNNVEQVKVTSPATGTWTITVNGYNIPGNGVSGTTTQPYALVMSGIVCSASAPSGMTAAAAGNNAILVDWNTVIGAIQYTVHRANSSGGPYTQIATVTAPTTQYTDTTVSGGITYYYVARATSSCESGYSSEVSASTTGACNLPPLFNGISSVTAPAQQGCTLDLAWNAATSQCGGTVNYSIYRSTSSGFTPSLSNRVAVGLTGTTYRDLDGLTPGTAHYYIIRSADGSNGVEDTNSVERSGTPLGLLTDGTWSTGAESGNPAMYTNTSWSISSARKHFGSNSYFSGYSNNLCAFVRTPTLTLTAGQSSTLTYWVAYEIESRYDGGVVEISTNDGSSWAVLTPTPGYPNSFRNTADACGYGNNQPSYTGTSIDTFVSYSVSLSTYNGQNVMVRWNFSTDEVLTYEGWYVDDISITHVQTEGACSGTPGDVLALTATAVTGTSKVKLEWVYPTGVSQAMLRYAAGSTPPATTADGILISTESGTAGQYDSYEHTGLTPGNTYSYTAFAYNGSTYASGRAVTARPFSTPAAVKWAYSTGAAALTPPGVEPGVLHEGAVFAVSNDRVLHSTNTSATGGDWPRTAPFDWEPLAMNAPSQARPGLALNSAVTGADELIAFVGTQDGVVYAIRAEDGGLEWERDLSAAPYNAEMIQAPIAAMYTDYGGDYDIVFAATRNATTANKIFALNPDTGAVLWSWDNGASGTPANTVGIISGGMYVDYANNRLYFASRARGGGSSNTLWCLNFTAATASLAYSANVGDVDGSPVISGTGANQRIYVGNNSGVVYARNMDLTPIWQHSLSGDTSAVKAYVFPEWTTGTPRRLFLSTSNNVWMLTDQGATCSAASPVAVAEASTPLYRLGSNYLYVGSTLGRLNQINVSTWATSSVTLGDGSAKVGSPSFDVVNGLLYVGTDDGKVYAVAIPW